MSDADSTTRRPYASHPQPSPPQDKFVEVPVEKLVVQDKVQVVYQDKIVEKIVEVSTFSSLAGFQRYVDRWQAGSSPCTCTRVTARVCNHRMPYAFLVTSSLEPPQSG